MKGFSVFLISWFLFAINCFAQSYKLKTPYKAQGFTEEEAIHYLIDKVTYGYTDALYEDIKTKGIDAWLSEQLNPKLDKRFEKKLARRYPVLQLNVIELGETYPGLVVTLRSAATYMRMNPKKERRLGGGINFNEMFGTTLRNVQAVNREWFYEMQGGSLLEEPMKEIGFGNFMDLIYQLQAQKLYRAVYSPYQIQEKLSDFWFNHFNVSITRINDVATNVLAYERDAIRPHILGDFEDMLKATAQHPAMLTYLDNTNSDAPEGTTTLAPYKERFSRGQNKVRSINENYARELLELHTLGVDGGYTQKDIEETARILTGWKVSPLIYPLPGRIEKETLKKRLHQNEHAVVKDGFYFNPRVHDTEDKMVLGKHYPSGRGYQEGLHLLKQLSSHPSTARFISKKLVTYFVSDNPPAELIEEMSSSFRESDGNIKTMMITMVESSHFWKKEYQKAKAKSPFEFVSSALRFAEAKIEDETELLRTLNKMGQPLFAYQPPTGYPNAASFWLNETAILQRITFSYMLPKNKVEGVMVEQGIETLGLANQLVTPQFQKR